MNRNQRRMAAYNAKKAAERQVDIRLARKVELALTGCSERVTKALIDIPRAKEDGYGSVCLADVALYSAGHRGKPKNPFHVYKSR